MGPRPLASRSWQRWLARYRLHGKLGLPCPVAPRGGSPGSGLNFFTSEIDKTPAQSGTWVDVDVSGDGVPAGATGVILRLHNADSAARAIAVRKNGSADTRTPTLYQGYHTGAMVGIDANRTFEAYIGSLEAKVYLVGYTTDSSDFLTNSVDKSPASGAWTDVDVSANIPSGAVGAIVELVNTSGSTAYGGGVRNNGSTDTFTFGGVRANDHYYQVCGVDANRVFEAWISNTAIQVWLIGYFMPPVSFEANAVSYALGSTGAWTDMAVSGGNAPADADGAMWLIRNPPSTDYSGGIRKNGSADESYATLRFNSCPAFFSGLDASRVAEGKIENLVVDHYVIGYARPAGATQKTVADALALADVPGVDAWLAVAESLGLADALPGGTPKALLSLAEAISLAESAPGIEAALSITQGLALADVLALKSSLTLAQWLTLAEVVAVAPKQSKGVADSLALADQVAAVVLLVRLLALASLLKEGLSLSGGVAPALDLSAVSGGGLWLESTVKGG